MKFIINAASVSEIGQRHNQEDSVYPQLGKVTNQDRLFILCDGMGGHEGGEVASSTVCTAMGEYLTERCDAEGTFRKVDFDYALSVAFDALDALDNGAAKKMGTTMTFLKFHSEGCMAAHIGDSRIYHIRPSENGEDRIRYVSRDHSLINDLVAAGEMTPEQALHSNQKNVITRAMLPGLDPRPKADIAMIGDIQPGDYFYMCSDGMLERMDDMELADIMAGEGTVEDKLQIIVGRTAENRDNHTAHLIEIVDVLGVMKPVATVHKKNSKSLLIALAVAFAAAIVGFIVIGRSDKSAPAPAGAPSPAPAVSATEPAHNEENINEKNEKHKDKQKEQQKGASDITDNKPEATVTASTSSNANTPVQPQGELSQDPPQDPPQDPLPKVKYSNKGGFIFNDKDTIKYKVGEAIPVALWYKVMGNVDSDDRDYRDYMSFTKGEAEKFVYALNMLLGQERFTFVSGVYNDPNKRNAIKLKYKN